MQYHAVPGNKRLCHPGCRLLHPAQIEDPFACLRAGHQSSLRCSESLGCLLHIASDTYSAVLTICPGP